MARKRSEIQENEARAHSYRQKWSEEYLKLKQSKEAWELMWHKELMQKRQQEDKYNEAKLMETRQKLMDAQIQLQILIEKKQDKSSQLVEEANKRRQKKFSKWKSFEEARRFAVEAALNELLARDTQYRKELRAHIESKIHNAERRRRIFRERSIEVNLYLVDRKLVKN